MLAVLLHFLSPLFDLVAVVNRKKSPTRKRAGSNSALSNAIRYVSALSFFRYAEESTRSFASQASRYNSPRRAKVSLSGGEEARAGELSKLSANVPSLAGHNVEGHDHDGAADVDNSHLDSVLDLPINHTAEDVFAFQPLEDSAERSAVVVDAGAAGSELDERAPAGSHLSHKPVSFQSNGMLSEKFAFMPSLFSPMQSSTVAPSYGQEVVEDM